MERLSLLCFAAAAGLARAVREIPSLGDLSAEHPRKTPGFGDGEQGHTFLKLKVPHGAAFSLAEVASNGTEQLQELSSNEDINEELQFFEKYGGVKEQWKGTLAVYKPTSTSLALLQQVKDWEVPGLTGTKFSEVLDAVQETCPLWIVGGAVRDLVAGVAPNDVDCIALCKSDLVAKVAQQKGWKHTVIDAYFAIGDSHGENPHYLEGFSGDLLFGYSGMAEMTTTILLWGLSADRIVDPSGRGMKDAQKKLLYPAVPDPVGDLTKGEKAQLLWEARQEWLSGGFTGPQLTRHVRYLKMRMRGWQPADECVRTFMANTLAAMMYVETVDEDSDEDDDDGLVSAFGKEWPFVPYATLLMLDDKFGQSSHEAQVKAGASLYNVYKEDMESYIAGDSLLTCGDDWQPPLVIDDQERDDPSGRFWKTYKPKKVSDVYHNGLERQCADAVKEDEEFEPLCAVVYEAGKAI